MRSAPTAATAPVNHSEFAWYSLLTAPSYRDSRVSPHKAIEVLERNVRQDRLANRFGRILAPTVPHSGTSGRRGRRRMPDCLLGDYVFIEMALDQDVWFVLDCINQQFRRVLELPSYDQLKSMRLSAEEAARVTGMQDALDAGKRGDFISDEVFQVGDRAKVIAGQFIDHEGTVIKVHQARRSVTLETFILGRAAPLELACNQITRA
jgi:transcription antitermination factor NusG